jgi:hypothetical protein
MHATLAARSGVCRQVGGVPEYGHIGDPARYGGQLEFADEHDVVLARRQMPVEPVVLARIALRSGLVHPIAKQVGTGRSDHA